MELVEKMTVDIKQAVRELREALRFVGVISYTEKLPSLIKACKEHLPAVLDRLEELENGWPSPKKVAELIAENADIRAERDAIRAKFAGLRKEYEAIAGFSDASLPERMRRQMVLDRFPALDSSDETEEGREG